MIRKLFLPALAAAVLAGCATGYDYRGGNGDYYYGQPSMDYYDGYYGGWYGYPGGWGGSLGFGYGYGGYGYGYPYYGYGYPYYPPVIIVRPDRPGPGAGGSHRPGQRPPEDRGPLPPSPLHGRGHPGSPPVIPPAGQRPAPMPRFDPMPSPGGRSRHEPSQPIRQPMRASSPRERDDSLNPNP